jgi:hypothetical protein
MKRTPIHVIITGSTGMVGEGVLHECLAHPDIASVLIINRRTLGLSHPKLTEIIHENMLDISSLEARLTGYQACFFCLGISSVGMKADKYYETTYTLTMNVANVLCKLNPELSFCYISGAGTDSSEKGRSRWTRVKGKTENDLMKLPFSRVYAFRPGFIKPTPGLMNIHSFYKYINWIFPIGRRVFPKGFCTMKELALAMINVVFKKEPNHAVEGREIISLAAE